MSHAYLGQDLLTRFAEQVGEHAQVERQPLLEGKQMSLVMASTHKPKVLAPQPERRHEQTDGAAPEPAAAAVVAATKSGAHPRKLKSRHQPKQRLRPKRRLRPKQTPRPTVRHQQKQKPRRRPRSEAAEEPKEASNTDPIKVAVSGLAGRSEQHAKMKSHKGAQKRFGVTGGGKVVRVKRRGHHLDIKSSRRTRLRGPGRAEPNQQGAGQAPAAVPLERKTHVTSQARRNRAQAPGGC